MRIDIDSPNAQNNRLSGTALVGGWAIDDLTGISQLAVSVDGVLIGNAVYGSSRPDVCAVFPNRAGCPNVGWTLLLDTTVLGDGTASMAFTVANLSASSPLHVAIDGPLPGIPISDIVGFGGWARDTHEPVTGVSVSNDGVLQGMAGSWQRPDVCAVYNNAPGCPNIGWNYYVDITTLSNGTHVLSVTASGVRATQETTFLVEN